MSYYLDIHLRQDPEFPSHQLLAALYTKLHRVLAQTKATTVSVSFPEYSDRPSGLGKTLRLIAPEGDLRRLMEHDWLRGMRDHTQVNAAAPVPATAEHRQLRRIQAKSSPERLRRRQIRRHGLTPEEAVERVPDSAAERLRLPFLEIRSASTGQTFRLYIRLASKASAPALGDFNAYGLSANATIPWF